MSSRRWHLRSFVTKNEIYLADFCKNKNFMFFESFWCSNVINSKTQRKHVIFVMTHNWWIIKHVHNLDLLKNCCFWWNLFFSCRISFENDIFFIFFGNFVKIWCCFLNLFVIFEKNLVFWIFCENGIFLPKLRPE